MLEIKNVHKIIESFAYDKLRECEAFNYDDNK